MPAPLHDRGRGEIRARPALPVIGNWPHLVRQLADFADGAVNTHGKGPIYYVGHSLGGYLSLMTACRHPPPAGRPIDGVLLLDSPLVGGWKAAVFGLIKTAGLSGRFPPGAISRRRRDHWPGIDELKAHFGSKPAFAAWHPDVLADYLAHGMQDHALGRRTLVFDRAVETAIYNGLPHNLAALLRRYPPPCPVAFIGGTRSAELKQVSLALTTQVTQGRITMLKGSHLFPMKRPHETAQAIAASLSFSQQAPKPP